MFLALVIGLYLLVPLGFALLGLMAKAREQRRTAMLLWGGCAWLLVAPAVALWLNFHEVHTIERNDFIPYSWDDAALVDDTGAAFLIAFLITSPLVFVPLARRILVTRNQSAQPA